jgi:histidinol-phosphate aminotransferase
MPYKPGKPHEEIERELGIKNSVKLASNENCLGPSPLALEAGRKVLDSAHLYPDGDHFYLKRRLSELSGIGSDRIIVGAGTTEILQLLAWCSLTPEYSGVFSDQAFIMYRLATQAAGGRCVAVPLDSSERHDLDAMLAAIEPTTKLVFVANPSNPTGTYVGREAMRRFVDAFPPHALLVLDEAYTEYVGAEDYPDGLEYVREGRPVLVLRTFSKIHGLAGMRVGYGLGPPEVVDALNRVRSPFNMTRLGLVMATAALDDHEHINRSRENNLKELDFLCRGLERLGLGITPSVTNFLLVELNQPAGPVFDRLLSDGVIVRPMAGYGFPTRVRISVGTHSENERLLAALEARLSAGNEIR